MTVEGEKPIERPYSCEHIRAGRSPKALVQLHPDGEPSMHVWLCVSCAASARGWLLAYPIRAVRMRDE